MGNDKAIVRVLKDYRVKKLADSNTHVMRIEIRGETSNRKYIVAKRNTALKRWECSCPGWIFSKKCKHIDAIVPILEQSLKMATEPKLLEDRRPRHAKKKKPLN